jgi:methylated-DNA-[protein]-cysteine S-methyltransferase
VIKPLRMFWIGEIAPTPLGSIWVAVTHRGLAAVKLDADQKTFEAWLHSRFRAESVIDAEKTASARKQITEYLAGERREFDLALDLDGLTAYQTRALLATKEIPYGETKTYNMIASALGNPQAARAVGRAEATNPLPLVIPCHRVIGKDGSLRGYAGPKGIGTKAWLLELEQKF